MGNLGVMFLMGVVSGFLAVCFCCGVVSGFLGFCFWCLWYVTSLAFGWVGLVAGFWIWCVFLWRVAGLPGGFKRGWGGVPFLWFVVGVALWTRPCWVGDLPSGFRFVWGRYNIPLWCFG